jgi:DNA-binding response OmpR family regulator
MTALVLIEPDDDTREHAHAYLATAFDVTATPRFAGNWSMLLAARPAAVVADAGELPIGALDICRVLKTITPRAAVVVTTEHLHVVPAAMRAGADAVLVKPISPVRLLARLRSALTEPNAAPPDLRTCPYCWEQQGWRVDQGTERRTRYRTCAACARIWRERPPGGRRRTDWRAALQIASPRPAGSR